MVSPKMQKITFQLIKYTGITPLCESINTINSDQVSTFMINFHLFIQPMVGILDLTPTTNSIRQELQYIQFTVLFSTEHSITGINFQSISEILKMSHVSKRNWDIIWKRRLKRGPITKCLVLCFCVFIFYLFFIFIFSPYQCF